MKYKISDVKRILNISEDTLRYFDNKKIINTIRDKNNNYRYFKAEDINKIFAYKMYRSLLFNMSDADQLISGSSVDMLETKLNEQLEVIGKEEEYLIRAKKHIALLTEKVLKWKHFKDGFEVTKSPGCYYHRNQTASDFIKEEAVFKDTYQCLNYLPDIWPCFCYAPPEYQSVSGFSFGYGFYTNQAPPIQGLLHLPPSKCLYSIFTLEGNLEQYLPGVLTKAEAYCKEHGYTPEGIVYGSILHEMKEDNRIIRLFDIYIPFTLTKSAK